MYRIHAKGQVSGRPGLFDAKSNDPRGDALSHIRENGITRVHVEGHDWAETPCMDVSALSQCSGIRRLSAGGCVSGLQQLVDTLHLEWLSIDGRFIRERIDLSPLTGLEYLSIYKIKKNLCGLSGLKSLKSFRSWNLNAQTGDLSALQGMTELKEMELNCPHLTSLFGASGFKALKKLSLCYCRKDLDITDLFSSETLDCIEIEKSNPRFAQSIKASGLYALSFDNGHYSIFRRYGI